MKFVIVTGLSGAGKSMAVNALEDIGFFCIDNIPVALLPRIVDFALQGENQLNRVAVVMDVRGVRSSEQLEQALSDLDARKFEYEILFLDANDAVIQRRYKETRRQHPITISEKLPITEAIARERRLLQPLRARRSMSSIPRCSAPPRTRSGCAACFWTTAKAQWPSRWCPSVSSTDCPRRQTLCWMSDACPTRSTCRS